jgi:ABC-2 type transport system ATP-binding protein
MIEVQDVVKDYGSYKALKGVSFKVEQGEILGFLGPNGAGKTTLMRILTCFLPASSGRAKVAGFDCEKEPMEVRKRVGYLPESVPLYTDMRVREFLAFAAAAKGLPRAERAAAAGRAMAETGTDVVSGRLIRQLSKGFRQRVGLAQALVGDPEVLILDEPTVGLDPRQISDIRSLIKSLAGRRTVILSTHILPEVSALCSRVVIINKGQVAESDTTANLAKKLSKSNKILVQVEGPEEAVMKAFKDLDKVKRVSGSAEGQGKGEEVQSYVVETAKDADLRPALAALVVKKGWGLRELRYVGMELEDIFLQLVTREDGSKAETQEEAA